MPPHARDEEEDVQEERRRREEITIRKRKRAKMNYSLHPALCATEGRNVENAVRNHLRVGNEHRLTALLWLVEGQDAGAVLHPEEDIMTLFEEVRFGQWPNERDRASYINGAINEFKKGKARVLGFPGAWETARMSHPLPPDAGGQRLEPEDGPVVEGAVQRYGIRHRVQTELVDATAGQVGARAVNHAARQNIRLMNVSLGAANKARIERVLWFKEAGMRPHEDWSVPIERKFITKSGGRHIQDDVRLAKIDFAEHKRGKWEGGPLPPGQHLPQEPEPNAPVSPAPEP